MSLLVSRLLVASCLLLIQFLCHVSQLDGAKEEIQELRKEQESLIDIFSEERQRREIEEENLRKKLKVNFLF